MTQNMNEHVKILQDWGDALAVFKPAGWLTVPGRGNKSDVPVLSHVLGEQLRGGSARKGEPDLFVVHRLDEGTSGVVVLARTAPAHRELSMLFETRDVKKTYWCLVKGNPQAQIIDAPIFKIPSKKLKCVVDSKGKPSITKLKPRAQHNEYTLLEIQPLTGRTHQIRVHLAHLGFPIIGDKTYGGPTELFGEILSYPLLHAREISLQWPKGTTRDVVAPLTDKFLKAVESLGFFPGGEVSSRD
jgi:RluA family pseudouridine synthase